MRFASVWMCLFIGLVSASDAHAKGPKAAKASEDDLLGNVGSSPVKPNPSSPPTADPPADKTPPPAASSAPKSVSKSTVTGSDRLLDPNSATEPGVTDRVKAVPRKDLLKRHRLELAPFAGISINDPYFVHLTLSGSAVFYPHDSFGIGLGVDYLYAHPRTATADAVRLGLTSVFASFDLPTLFGHLDMYWLPVYGKVSFFNAFILNFDLYASAGIGAVTAFGSRNPVEVNLAIGQHYALQDWLALRVEIRDHIFVDTQVANGIPRSSLQNYVLCLVGLSFFVPPTFEYTFQ